MLAQLEGLKKVFSQDIKTFCRDVNRIIKHLKYLESFRGLANPEIFNPLIFKGQILNEKNGDFECIVDYEIEAELEVDFDEKKIDLENLATETCEIVDLAIYGFEKEYYISDLIRKLESAIDGIKKYSDFNTLIEANVFSNKILETSHYLKRVIFELKRMNDCNYDYFFGLKSCDYLKFDTLIQSIITVLTKEEQDNINYSKKKLSTKEEKEEKEYNFKIIDDAKEKLLTWTNNYPIDTNERKEMFEIFDFIFFSCTKLESIITILGNHPFAPIVREPIEVYPALKNLPENHFYWQSATESDVKFIKDNVKNFDKYESNPAICLFRLKMYIGQVPVETSSFCMTSVDNSKKPFYRDRVHFPIWFRREKYDKTFPVAFQECKDSLYFPAIIFLTNMSDEKVNQNTYNLLKHKSKDRNIIIPIETFDDYYWYNKYFKVTDAVGGKLTEKFIEPPKIGYPQPGNDKNDYLSRLDIRRNSENDDTYASALSGDKNDKKLLEAVGLLN
jgi:hypothetical protein